MYQSTDHLVSHEQGASKEGYQSVEGGPADTPSDPPASLLASVRKAKQDSQGCCDFCLTFFGLLLGSIVWTIVLVITLTLPLVMIVIGAEFFNDCPAQRMIPILLVVAGCVLMVSNVMNLVARFRKFSDPAMPRRTTIIGWITTIMNVFLMIWFFAGCYWVYDIYEPSFKAGDAKYCNFTLYAFSFWMLTSCFIFFGFMVIIASLTMCLALICW